MKKLAVIVASLMAVGYVGAASANTVHGNFNGFAVGVGVGYNHNEVKFDHNGANSKDKKGGVVGQVAVEYSMPLSNEFIMSAGATYDVNKTKASKKANDVKLANHASIYVAPGFLVNGDVLVYGKVGYNYAKLEANHETGKHKVNLNGVGLGLGVSYAFAPNMEVGLEGDYVIYKNKKHAQDAGKIKPRTAVVMLNYKYRF